MGTDPGADRVTIDFTGGLAGTAIDLIPHADTKFVLNASGAPITLAGKYGLLIRIKGADNHTAFSGSTDLKTPTFPEILEASKVGDFVGVVQWGVGLAASARYQATVISNPTRLVIDIRNS